MIIKGYFENMDIYIKRKEKLINKYNEENNLARLIFRTIHNEQFYVKEIEGENWGINVVEELKEIVNDIVPINDNLDKLEKLGYISQKHIPSKQFGFRCPVYPAHRRARLTKKGYDIVSKLDLLLE